MKKNISGFVLFGSIAILLFFIAGCKKGEDIKTSPVKPEVTLEDSRVKAVHLYNDTVYILSSQFYRQAGEQLIIDAGTLIKVAPGNVHAGITINAGGTILANGTSQKPIVFTSSTYMGHQSENWGGITIQGKSINNNNGNTGNVTDNSGYLRYARIEFASLTLNAVGSGTVIEDIMVSYTNYIYQDASLSSFNFYGGSFNCRSLISYACGGPADFYITNGYTGNMQDVIAIRHPFFGGTGDYPANALTGIFIENSATNPVDARPVTAPIISNLTIMGPNTQNGTMAVYNNSSITNAALVTTGNTSFKIRNSIFMGYPIAAWNLGDSLTGKRLQANEAEFSHCVVQCNDTAKAFYINPDVYPSFTNNNFKALMLQPVYKNQLLFTLVDFKLITPYNYDALNPLPAGNSPVMTGASFDGPYFKTSFFKKVNYKGALGGESWWQGWVNASPLKTNYNFPQ